MLELLGDDYISQHIYNEQYREFIDISYKVYVTDRLKELTGVDGRWYPKIADLEKPKEPEVTVDEMLDMVRSIH